MFVWAKSFKIKCKHRSLLKVCSDRIYATYFWKCNYWGDLLLRLRGIVVMDFDCYTGDRGSIPTHGDSFGKWMNLLPGHPMPCEGNWVVSPRCWRDIDLHSVYNCENGLFSLMQFNHIHITMCLPILYKCQYNTYTSFSYLIYTLKLSIAEI